MRRAASDIVGTVEILDQVPSTSRHLRNTRSAWWWRWCTVGIWRRSPRRSCTRPRAGCEPCPEVEWRRLQLRALVLGVALGWVQHRNQHGRLDGTATLLDHALTERGLRKATEKALRDLAALAERKRQRHALVDLANAIRPTTVF
ncbi:Serine/threonine-protein kinase PknG OS=Tsukamurella paurometabola (strain ATCC 8368 / DSM /CCUG 35730 / CIP 100753 / JCM 10117 / KCTC 9821 / NBRC 16120/ NCIMB 702349 / NCTC 13040) OX=521096 GN=Tpau_3755 PE=4 SV=1 [Tsukamurella paurometabola]